MCWFSRTKVASVIIPAAIRCFWSFVSHRPKIEPANYFSMSISFLRRRRNQSWPFCRWFIFLLLTLAQIFGETAQQAFMAMLIFMARVRVYSQRKTRRVQFSRSSKNTEVLMIIKWRGGGEVKEVPGGDDFYALEFEWGNWQLAINWSSRGFCVLKRQDKWKILSVTSPLCCFTLHTFIHISPAWLSYKVWASKCGEWRINYFQRN